MKVIPVIDILNGQVVHAVRGKRSEYKPLQSDLTNSSEPVDAAKSFKALGFGELYVADLDAIIDCSSDFETIEKMIEATGLRLMVDAGVTTADRAQSLIDKGVSKVVVGTETLRDQTFVDEAVKLFGSNRIIMSLDLKDDQVVVQKEFEGNTDPFLLLKEFRNNGVSQVIVLYLTKVGSAEGVNVDFLRKIFETTHMDVYVGGGVRNMADLIELKSLGVSGVLVATALHSGRISVEELTQTGLL